jgi:zinc transporter, ZIP family
MTRQVPCAHAVDVPAPRIRRRVGAMVSVLDVVAVATLTVLATGLGALPVLASASHAQRLQPWLDGLVIGVMSVAAVAGLLVPAVRHGSPASVTIGVVVGVAGLWWARSSVRRHIPGDAGIAERAAELTFGVLLVHSLPEGLALGSAMAAQGDVATLVVVAIAIQNIPEGTATAVTMMRAGRGPATQVGAAILTSVPQIPGAVVAFLAVDAIAAILPASLAAAGAAMLLLVGADLVPAGARSAAPRRVASGALAGGLAMAGLALALGAG